MAESIRGETTMEIGGKAYRLRYDWNAAAAFEEASGKALEDLFRELQRSKVLVSARSTRALLWAGLNAHHPEVTLSGAGDLLGQMKPQVLALFPFRAFNLLFPRDLEDGAQPPDPPAPAAA